MNKHAALLRAQEVLPHRTYHTLMDRCYRISEELWKRDLPWVQGWKPPAMGNQRPNTVNMAATIWNAVESMTRKYRNDESVRDDAAIPGGRGGESRSPDETVNSAQAYGSEAELRQAIEGVAQLRLMQHFEKLGWTVEDTHLVAPYDARAAKGSLVQYLEAKGTTSAGESVFVTRGEVEWARDHAGECVMGIVSSIELDPTGRVDPASGVLRLVDWNPQVGDLQVVQYQWSPSAD
ncbi:DUF3883 domain-containing protein [Nocardioides sp.]|uniref:protein NO VEIN domain-containing protein n=1 Tax=Nocardioides sp. TaxID=35761 RepID=UPI002733ADE4|nr:DUF3883 domain-containing protein [Nocardioides sp.]MDP3892122.1 DUF3883 domain-containing protein [Nocardioides sp.]